jgi:hypothetical protein
MDEKHFYEAVTQKAKEVGINPLLLLSGIEGLFTFRDVQLNAISFDILDNLILTIFALRIGDQFHALAEQQLVSQDEKAVQAAAAELRILTPADIAQSDNKFLQSFATILSGKSPVRRYHEKALEVAALEVNKANQAFASNSIGTIVLEICKSDQSGSLNLDAIFRN